MFSLKTQEVDCCEPKTRAEGRSSGMCAIIIITAAAAAAAVRLSDKTQRENPALLGWWYTVGAPVCCIWFQILCQDGYTHTHLCLSDWMWKARTPVFHLAHGNLKSQVERQFFPTGVSDRAVFAFLSPDLCISAHFSIWATSHQHLRRSDSSFTFRFKWKMIYVMWWNRF